MTCLDSKKRERLQCAAIYLCFGLYMLLCHLPLPYCGDDAYLLPLVGNRGFGEHFRILYGYNGKIFTDFLAFVFYHGPYGLWKAFNAVVFALLAVLLTRLFAEGRPLNALISCLIAAVFPLGYLSSAGYIASSANYLYPLVGILLLACQVKDLWTGRPVHLLRHLLGIPVMAYVLNQDQAACILVGGLLLVLCGALLCRKEKNICLWLGGYFLVAAVGYGLMFIMPGHLNRMADPTEMNLYLPEFARWSLGKKLYRGYSSTVAQVFLQDARVCVLFFFLLFLLCQQHSRLCRVLSALPLCGFLGLKLVGKDRFLVYYHYMPDLKPLSSLGGVAGLLFCTGCLAIMVYCICRCVSGQNRWLLLGMLVLGAGSRLMMGFSATIYASSVRTFTYLFFSLLMGCMILLREMKETRYAGMAGVMLALLLN